MLCEKINELLGTKYTSDQRIDWNEISFKYKLSEDFIEEYKDKLNWNWLSYHQTLSESLIEKNLIRISWEKISRYQVLSENFLAKYKDQIDWVGVCSSQILSREFINDFIKEEVTSCTDRVWSAISENQPYIDQSNPLIDPMKLSKNSLYNLYQTTKDQGWFIGYTNELLTKKNNIFFSDKLVYLIRSVVSLKIKIYWKDLITLSRIKRYEFIREVKYT